ncbi:Anti-sigma F factor antagonist [Streptomyces cyanogenus]|uniref:Anti-sigma factor antagonist n=2 Tax=Streptomyces cyanogenus TaxID=80860 RepID=A0ABX7THG4_STRCY|nr:Anti-sigma F factor antagonist [Streptomyces cyanogenus]
MTDTEQAEQVGGLSVVATAADGVRVLTLAGEIDHHTGDQLRNVLDVTGTARPRIVVDMRRVTFMDSSGINLLIAVYRAVTEADGWLRLAAPTDSVLRVLHLVGIDGIIECHPTPPSPKPSLPDPLHTPSRARNVRALKGGLTPALRRSTAAARAANTR